jgi:hypothetical protein
MVQVVEHMPNKHEAQTPELPKREMGEGREDLKFPKCAQGIQEIKPHMLSWHPMAEHMERAMRWILGWRRGKDVKGSYCKVLSFLQVTVMHR